VLYKKIIANTIKGIMIEHPGVVKLSSSSNVKQLDVTYSIAEKLAEKLNRSYYFGTDLHYDNQEEFQKTFKELLQVKRALKEIK
jgi:hypothetical protein